MRRLIRSASIAFTIAVAFATPCPLPFQSCSYCLILGMRGGRAGTTHPHEPPQGSVNNIHHPLPNRERTRKDLMPGPDFSGSIRKSARQKSYLPLPNPPSAIRNFMHFHV